ncbi:hypothetical protein G5C33_16885 [Sphingosinithalassobacter tenebrarum]|uniref:Uncharacterized protein n=1 Tax=Stakelama tenebrarum TaxID=2711215 RepID=A0A6G6YBC4_9SPHN|nr:hypothetical protein G5C33_16885 [Sphingosinithalassobacter tenebrarum]
MIEALHIIAGLLATVVIAWIAAWSYVPGERDIWITAVAAMAAVIAMGVNPMRRAWAADKANPAQRVGTAE